MANSTYDRRWQEAMMELNEQVHIEDHTLGDASSVTSHEPPPQASIVEAFQHYACLYIKYIQILARLSECYDQMVHPQKRIDVKQVIEVVATRIVELKHLLVKWNPPNPDVRTQPEQSFPWDYVHLDDILVDLKLPPATIELPVSQSFRDEQLDNLVRRDRLVKGYMKLKHGVDSIALDGSKPSPLVQGVEVLSLDEAIGLIQKNERGRQGRQRGRLVHEMREQERHRKVYETSPPTFEVDPDVAATTVQRMFRGFWSRVTANRAREAELVFIGMKAPYYDRAALDTRLANARLQRRAEQVENQEEYARALVDLHGVVTREEGPMMKETMLEERRRWITDMMAGGQLPEDLAGFYATGNEDKEVEARAEAKDASKNNVGGKKGSKSKTKEVEKGGKGAKGKGKEGKSSEEDVVERPPPLTGQTELGTKLAGGVAQYEKVWLERQELEKFYQKYDVALAKDVVRGPVEVQVRQQVDEMLVLQLVNIKAQLEAASLGKKGKKGKKGNGKKGQVKKGKKSGLDKGKKSKALPGEKIADVKGRAPESFLSVLVDHQIVHAPRPGVRVCDFIGSFNFLGTSLHHLDRRDRAGNWVPQDPSAAQLRQLIIEYGVLPLSSPFLRARTPLIRSLLLYGPRGAGKTLLVSALANETGALLLNLSPRNLLGKFSGKTGPTKLVHMAFMLAKATTLQPIIIYIDECEQMFAGNGKKPKASAAPDGPARFKKDLLLYLKAALEPSDRVLVVGTSADPEAGDAKELRACFDKFLYVPYPDYASRVLLWKHATRATIVAHAASLNLSSTATTLALAAASFMSSTVLAASTIAPQIQDARRPHPLLDISTLAHVSEGYTSGSIVRAVENTLTPRRVECLPKRPLHEAEFLDALSHQAPPFAENIEKYQTFTALITGLKDTRDKLRKAALEAKEGQGKGDKKGKKAKK